jgi:hypothetical protein
MNKRDGQAFFKLLTKLYQKLNDNKTEGPTILVVPVPHWKSSGKFFSVVESGAEGTNFVCDKFP